MLRFLFCLLWSIRGYVHGESLTGVRVSYISLLLCRFAPRLSNHFYEKWHFLTMSFILSAAKHGTAPCHPILCNVQESCCLCPPLSRTCDKILQNLMNPPTSIVTFTKDIWTIKKWKRINSEKKNSPIQLIKKLIICK